MKKVYETPVVDKINFDYENQVVASGCTHYYHTGPTQTSDCQDQTSYTDSEAV